MRAGYARSPCLPFFACFWPSVLLSALPIAPVSLLTRAPVSAPSPVSPPGKPQKLQTGRGGGGRGYPKCCAANPRAVVDLGALQQATKLVSQTTLAARFECCLAPQSLAHCKPRLLHSGRKSACCGGGLGALRWGAVCVSKATLAARFQCCLATELRSCNTRLLHYGR